MSPMPESVQVIRDEHVALSSVLQTMQLMIRQGPGEERQRFFDALAAMLLYIDEFPERQHHRKESLLLFPMVAEASPSTKDVLLKLEQDHQSSESAVRDLQHLLLAWRFLGDARRPAFAEATTHFVTAYGEHMRLEESVILPAALASLSGQEWAELDQAFRENRDPLTGKFPVEGVYEKLFEYIVLEAPAPYGLGG